MIISNILDNPGSCLPIDCSFDWSGLEVDYQKPVSQPVQVTGKVTNTAGLIELSATLSTVLHAVCDRCLVPFERDFTLDVLYVLATSREDDENEDIVLIEGNGVDLEQLVRDSFVLEADMTFLCGEDCRGLCPGCGASLNSEDCRCEKAIDPRLAGLKGYFES